MNLYEYNKGYADGYESACKDMKKFLNSKDINPIDQMYGRYTAVTSSPEFNDRASQIGETGATGPIGYMP